MLELPSATDIDYCYVVITKFSCFLYRKKVENVDATRENVPKIANMSVTEATDHPSTMLGKFNYLKDTEAAKSTQNPSHQRKASYLYSARSGLSSDGSNLLRVRNSALGKSAPTLSANTVNLSI